MEGRVSIRQVLGPGQAATSWRIKGWRGALALGSELFKLRIVALLLWAAFGGAVLGADGLPAWKDALVLLFTGGSAAAGASALNQYLERGRDATMRRTRNRPLVRGDLGGARWLPWLALGLVLVPALAVLPTNAALATFLLLGAAIYVPVYTLWLKPRTVLNIVIGGAAGSAAVLSGGAAVGNWSSPYVIGLALLIFLWTPSHFWSLALLYRADYQRGGFPMLPAVTTPSRAAGWVLLHALAVAFVGLLLALQTTLGALYLTTSLVASVWFVAAAYKLLVRADPQQSQRVFMASNLYLALVLGAMLVDSALG